VLLRFLYVLQLQVTFCQRCVCLHLLEL
jgi:hypothetical protein